MRRKKPAPLASLDAGVDTRISGAPVQPLSPEPRLRDNFAAKLRIEEREVEERGGDSLPPPLNSTATYGVNVTVVVTG